MEKEAQPNQPSESLNQLHRLLSIPPYAHQGIPLFSSLLKRIVLEDILRDIRSDLVPKFIVANKAAGHKFTSGMFIELESCKSNIQKTNCYEWAKCHNISMEDVHVESEEQVSDSCQQVQFIDVLVGMDNMKVTVGAHQHLRIRMDSEVHDMRTTSAKWRIDLRKPKKYDKNRPCLLQGTVQRGGELLILDFSTWHMKIDLILAKERKKVRITFHNLKVDEKVSAIQNTVFYWALAIAAFFLLLVTAVILMHREKTRRLEKTLKSVNSH